MIQKLRDIDEEFQKNVTKLREEFKTYRNVDIFNSKTSMLKKKFSEQKLHLCQECIHKILLKNVGLSETSTVREYIDRIQKLSNTAIKISTVIF